MCIPAEPLALRFECCTNEPVQRVNGTPEPTVFRANAVALVRCSGCGREWELEVTARQRQRDELAAARQRVLRQSKSIKKLEVGL